MADNQGIAALMALNSLELEEALDSMPWGSAEHMHAAIESMRLGFVDALQYNADPEVCPDSGDKLGTVNRDYTLHALVVGSIGERDRRYVLNCCRWYLCLQTTCSARNTPSGAEQSCSDPTKCVHCSCPSSYKASIRWR